MCTSREVCFYQAKKPREYAAAARNKEQRKELQKKQKPMSITEGHKSGRGQDESQGMQEHKHYINKALTLTTDMWEG